MNTGKIIKLIFGSLALGLGLSIVEPVRGQVTEPESLFQYAIFYSGLLEFTDCSPLTINGPVRCNTNIYVGCPVSYSTLAFDSLVITSGIITNPSWYGYPQSSYIASNITFNGTPVPGYTTGAPALSLPIGTNDTGSGAIQILYPPAANETGLDPISAQRFYNKAFIVITVTDSNIVMNLKNSTYDPSPISLTNGPAGSLAAINWTNNTKYGFFFSTNSSFYEARQATTNHVSQIDVGLLGSWIETNTNCMPSGGKWETNGTIHFNGIVYVQDLRDTNTSWMDCVRITNGANITNGLYASGLTVATPNPLYVWGNYNCPNTNYLQTTNVTQSPPAAFICDAFTVLSTNWKDSSSTSAAASTTVNAAIIAGNVPSTGSSYPQYSGGVQNLARLLENWNPVFGQQTTLWMNTSLICLYASAQATAQYQPAGNYYEPPIRSLLFNLNYTIPGKLPPGTPSIMQIPAAVTLTNLNQIYNGTTLNPTAVTVPSGLKVSLNYDYSTPNWILPVSAGSYIVIAAISDPIYTGATTNTFIISQATAGVTITNLSQTYSGSGTGVSVTTVPAGLNVNATYNGAAILPTNAGVYTVVATVNDTNYQGSVTNTLVINQAVAAVTLSNLSQVFSGAAENVSISTVPPGLMVNVTYNGATNAPTNAGSYSVVATVNDTNYQGSATNTLVIVPPAATPIMLGGSTVLADGTFQLNFTNTPGASFSVLGSADPTAPVADWTVLGSAIEVSPGQFQFIDLDATNEALQFYMISSP